MKNLQRTLLALLGAAALFGADVSPAKAEFGAGISPLVLKKIPLRT
ncbi:hypothetical protein BH24DEI2_BH24DEI2_14310 [soil metagenome]